MENACLIILNCEKYEHKRQKQFDLWLKDDFIIPKWFHVRGKPELESEYVFDHSNNLLYVKCKDDYLSLCQKTYLAIKAIFETYPEVTHLLKTDDDMTYVPGSLENLFKVIHDYDYGGRIVHVSTAWCTHHYKYYEPGEEKHPKWLLGASYANGRFYFLNRATMEHIITKKRKLFFDNTFEDNIVGHAMRDFPNLRIYDSVNDFTIFKEY